MVLIYKQLFKQMIKDKIFLSLLFVLTILTSLSFFFVMFSVDGNRVVMIALEELSENQQLYKNALHSNTILAYKFFASVIGLTALVFIIFFYRFFRANKKQIGCIKALGFNNRIIQIYFVVFAASLSFVGALLGLIGGYFLSDFIIEANSQTYAVTGLVKEIGNTSLIIGLTVSTLIFSMVAFLCCGFVKNKEESFLLAGNNRQNQFTITLKIADLISKIAPIKRRLSVRIALRKPLSVALLFAAVMSFNVCIILGQSLNISSAKVYDMQTEGHNYKYEVKYLKYQTKEVSNNTMIYIDTPAIISIKHNKLERTLTGLYHINNLYELKNQKSEILSLPDAGKVYINPELSEIYGVDVGDTLLISIKEIQQSFIVEEIAMNAKAQCIYMNGQELTELLGVKTGAYNGIFSKNEMSGNDVTTKEQHIKDLNRNAVSNKISGVINQAIGIFAGAILIYLALYINFQDNTHDILILYMLGHSSKEIRKMLIDVYLPILWISFMITFPPSIYLAKTIQKSLSISTNDYMPFGINVYVIMAAFTLISIIYWAVQITFSIGIKKTINKRKITDIVYAE